MWNDKEVTIKNMYGMESPDPKHMKERMKKVKAIINKMGDKYCLAKQVERKDAGL